MAIDHGPRTIDLMINAACNLSCPFCYGPDPAHENLMPPADFRELMHFLASVGIEGLVVSGGEPTLRPDLRERLLDIREQGMWIALQSNGTRRRHLHDVVDCLTWLALPLDTVETTTGQLMRTSSLHPRTTRLATSTPQVRAARAAGMSLKISTVVTRLNIAELPTLAGEVATMAPDVWKIHQFRPRGEGRLNRNWLEVEDDEFLDAVAQLSVSDFPVSASAIADSVNAYMIINPDSTVLIPQRDHYLSFGQLIVDGQIEPEVYARALAALDLERHISNSLGAFPEAGYTQRLARVDTERHARASEPVIHFDRETTDDDDAQPAHGGPRPIPA